MKTQTVYVPVEVKDRLPEIDSPEIFLLDDGNAVMDYFDRELSTVDCVDYTHWLEKKDNMIVMSLEELEKVIGNAFIAGENCESLCRRGYQSEAVPRKQYIDNLLNK